MKPAQKTTEVASKAAANVATIKRRWILTRIVQGFTVSGLAFLTYPFV